MKQAIAVCLVAGCGWWAASATGAADPAKPVTFEVLADRVKIAVAGEPFGEYVFRDERIRRPYLAHVRAPGGANVTRNHPPLAGSDATDHDTMHPGIWLAFGDLSGHDFWRNKGTVEHVRFVETPKSDDRGGAFTVENRYLADGKTICLERCQLRFEPLADGTLLVWDSTFSGPADFTLGDQEEMGLGLRVATPLTVKAGGRLSNSEGRVNEKQVWGRQADWCDYSGTIDGQPLGILLVPDPKNFSRSWFHARDYGVLVANAFARRAFTQGEPQTTVVRTGEKLRLRYGVLVHRGPIELSQAAQTVTGVLAR